MTLDDVYDSYGYIVYLDEDNGICLGIMLDDRKAFLYYLDSNNNEGDTLGLNVISNEEVDYYDIVSDFPEVFENCENAEVWFRNDIIDDADAISILNAGHKELEKLSLFCLGMI